MIKVSNWLTRTAAAVVLLAVPMATVQANNSDPTDLANCQVTDLTPTADACRGYIDSANDFLNTPLFVNDFDGGLFGGGWTFDSKVEESGGNTVKTGNDNIDITSTLPANSGTWAISNILDLIANNEDAMLVFKASNGFNAYLYEMFGPGIETGSWTMYSGPDRRLTDISHITLYLRGDGQDIPLPATMGLLGIGLIGLGAGLMRRRRA